MHSHDWIISVLSDIEGYSKLNGIKETGKSAEFLRTIVENEIIAMQPNIHKNKKAKTRLSLHTVQGGQPVSD